MSHKPVPHFVVFLNGPPGSGKNLAAATVMRHFNARHYKMAAPLKKTLAAMFNIAPDMATELFETPLKEEPCELFNGMTPRQALIDLSENYMKPTFGEDVFGRIAVRSLPLPCAARLTVISDSGFEVEAVPLVKRFGARNCALIQIIRDQCTFDGDSRSYIELDKHGVVTDELVNKFEKEMYEVQIVRAVRNMTGLEPATTILD